MPMSVVKLDASAVDVAVTDDQLVVVLADGRELAAPLMWFPRLLEATPDQRRNWRLIGRGHGIHWPDVDEDISVTSLLEQRKSRTSRRAGRAGLDLRAHPVPAESGCAPDYALAHGLVGEPMSPSPGHAASQLPCSARPCDADVERPRLCLEARNLARQRHGELLGIRRKA